MFSLENKSAFYKIKKDLDVRYIIPTLYKIENIIKIREPESINIHMSYYNIISFLNQNRFNIIEENKKEMNNKKIVRDFMTYIYKKDYKIKDDFELISKDTRYVFEYESKYKYGFSLFTGSQIGKAFLYSHAMHIFFSGENNSYIDDYKGYHYEYSTNTFLSDLYNFLNMYTDEFLSKFKDKIRTDILSNISFSIYQVVSTYLEDNIKDNLTFTYHMDTESIISEYSEYEEDEEYEEDDSSTYSDCNMIRNLNFLLDVNTKDFVFDYESDIHVTLYYNDADVYDGAPIGFSLNVAKNKDKIKIRFETTFYIDNAYNNFVISLKDKDNKTKKRKRVKKENTDTNIEHHNIIYYKEIDCSKKSNEKYKSILKEIDDYIENILNDKILISFNDNVVS